MAQKNVPYTHLQSFVRHTASVHLAVTSNSVHGSFTAGATTNLESDVLIWDTATCILDTNSIDGNAFDPTPARST